MCFWFSYEVRELSQAYSNSISHGPLWIKTVQYCKEASGHRGFFKRIPQASNANAAKSELKLLVCSEVHILTVWFKGNILCRIDFFKSFYDIQVSSVYKNYVNKISPACFPFCTGQGLNKTIRNSHYCDLIYILSLPQSIAQLCCSLEWNVSEVAHVQDVLCMKNALSEDCFSGSIYTHTHLKGASVLTC